MGIQNLQLGNIGDVEVGNRGSSTDGYLLSWSDAKKRFVLAASSGGATELDDLSDVIAPTGGWSDGAMLIYDGSTGVDAFVEVVPSDLDSSLQVTGIQGLSFTNSASVGQPIIKYNGTNLSWSAATEYDDVVHCYRAAAITLTGTFAAIDWDTNVQVGTDFAHSTSTNPSEITINVACRVEIHVDVTAEFTGTAGTSNANTLEIELQVNTGGGFAAVTGTSRGAAVMPLSGHYGTACLSWHYNASAGDKIRVMARKIRTTAATAIDIKANASSVVVRQISDGA